jgi:hypothetical protein
MASPGQAKNYPDHEPRNGLRMRRGHRRLFDDYYFFIRFFRDVISLWP